MIKIFNEDCINTINRFIEEGVKVDIILTSPPYNNSRVSHTELSMKTANCRYDSYDDNMTNEEYFDWTVNLFNKFDSILKDNGVILYNISYGGENPNCMWEVVADIIRKTPFMVADNIVWKKSSALPNNVTKNKLTRICEYVFVFSRKNEFDTFFMNKPITSKSSVGQNFYGSIFNFIQAKNNDGICELNKATYSSELCEKLLNIYANPRSCLVYDPFMGTGTTAVACKKLGFDCYGSEISYQQCKYADDRLNDIVRKESVSYNRKKLFD